jgi:hypothetical protein
MLCPTGLGAVTLQAEAAYKPVGPHVGTEVIETPPFPGDTSRKPHHSSSSLVEVPS